STQVYVSDMAANALVAFDQRTGATNWTTASTPGVLRAPSSITGLPGGGVAALDAAGMLVRIDRRGRLMSSASLIDGNIARQICAFDDSTFLIAYMRQRFPLSIVDAAGHTQKQLELPWEKLREMTPMQTQLLLAGASANRCIVSLAFGQGFAALRKESVEWVAPYVESVAIPGVDAKTTTQGSAANTVSHIDARHVAVRDLSADGDAIEMIFEGATRQQGSFIDQYQASTGAYRGTRLASRRVVGIQTSGERAFFLVGLQGYPALVALRMSDQPK
ncbi:MAG: hypothetical protein JWM95_1419, partial [Gemmatimonadetes bacterium]|nr:hypothetical protein [Gemmatimonadota bacterium]